jgi:hypothetical protein
MRTRPFIRLSLLVVAVAAITLSCSLDYMLDFNIDLVDWLGDTVWVDYSLINHGSHSMDNVTINIRVTPNGGAPLTEQWTTPGVDLLVGESTTGTLTLTFTGYTITNATAEVIGAGWDEHTSSD